MRSRKRNRRKLSAQQQLKRWLKPSLLLVVFSLLGWNIYHYNPEELLKVDINWNIDNTNLVNQEALKKQIAPLVSESYQLDLQDIKRELEYHPWVLEAKLKRLFWDTINININTHKIAAYWQNINCEQDLKQSNCRGYITTQGDLITPKNLLYHQEDKKLENLIELKSTYNLEKSTTLLDDYHAYQYILDDMKINKFIRSNIDSLKIKPNITVILGYSQQQQRLKNFIKIYQKLRQKIPLKKLNKATYDMRYSKGFTLKY